MKLLGVLSALIVFGAASLVPSQPVSAGAPYNTHLKVSGIVLPAQQVVVDEQGTIIEISSNTTHDVMPEVYLNKIAKENARDMTPEIYQQYRRLVPPGHSHVGTLYKHTPIIPLEPAFQTTPYKLSSPLLNNN